MSHGHSSGGKITPEYRVWQTIKNICLKPNDSRYKWYGAKGVTVCESWQGSFEHFLADVGLRPSNLHSLKMIDKSLGYRPGNVEWATAREVNRDKRTTKTYLLDLDGDGPEARTLREWAEEFDVPYQLVAQRINKFSWSLEEALSKPPGGGGRCRNPRNQSEWDRMYYAWWAMVCRCHDSKNRAYKNYGGRGIHVCARWRDSFSDFFDDVESTIGLRPSREYTMDRMDTSRGYEPDNIRWATATQQNRNRRNTRFIELYGESRTLKEWCELAEIPYDVVKRRFYVSKWPLAEALGTPIGGLGRPIDGTRRTWIAPWISDPSSDPEKP